MSRKYVPEIGDHVTVITDGVVESYDADLDTLDAYNEALAELSRLRADNGQAAR